MKFTQFFVFTVVLALFAGQAKAKISLTEYNRVYHGLAFGMGPDALLEVYKARLQARFRERIAGTADNGQKDRLTRKMNLATKAVKSWVVRFTKDNKTWDASVLSGEFIKGRGEVMIKKTIKDTKQYFFFHNNKLTKVIEIKTKPLSTYMFKFSSLYGKPFKVKYRGNQTRKPSEIIWEDGTTRFSIKSIGDPFNCVMLRWAQQSEDDKWQALRAKAQSSHTTVDKMVREVQSKQRDNSVDKKMEELLGPGNKPKNPKSSLLPLLP